MPLHIFLGEILSVGSFNWKLPLLPNEEDSEILDVQIFFDEYERIQYIIEFKGSFQIDDQYINSSGKSDLLLLCVSRISTGLCFGSINLEVMVMIL